MTALVLAHSPLTGAAAWGALPDALRERGHDVVVLDVRDDDTPPYAHRYVAHAALQIAAASADPVALIGHSGAGYLLPQLGAARRAARQPVSGYIFVDAGIPSRSGATRLSLLHAEDDAFAHTLEQSLRAGGRFPDWTGESLRDLVPDPAARGALVDSLRPRGLDFFTEVLPFPGDWPDAPCGYLQLSAAYDAPARLARLRGWAVHGIDVRGGHFAACTDPVLVADALSALLADLR